jgi:3-phenylpropionate/cinnamic acid dioxygenase small subunit
MLTGKSTTLPLARLVWKRARERAALANNGKVFDQETLLEARNLEFRANSVMNKPSLHTLCSSRTLTRSGEKHPRLAANIELMVRIWHPCVNAVEPATAHREASFMKSDKMQLEKTIAWLKDRAELDELVAAYAQAVDDRDFAKWQSLFTDDGAYINLRDRVEKKNLAIFGNSTLEPYSGTQHLMGQHSIVINGDDATGRSYFIASHITGDFIPSRNDGVGGWYNFTYRRTAEGWRIVKADVNTVVISGGDYFGREKKTV